MVAATNTFTPKISRAFLEIRRVRGVSTVTSALAENPLKLFTSRTGETSVWAYLSSYGGGFVAGDQTRLDLQLAPQTRCFLSTQASTKVYRNPGALPCGHQTIATLGEGSLLVFAPDPIQAFAGSAYAQRQEFHLAAGAGLVLVDSLSSGRVACGERWAFQCYASRNEVFVDGSRVFLDALRLRADENPGSPPLMGRYNCLATLLMVGELVRAGAQALLDEIAAHPVSRAASLVCSASPVAGGVLLRIAGEQTAEVGQALRRHLQFVSPLLGDDPWARKC